MVDAVKSEFVGLGEDATLDDMPDVPSFGQWPTGTYHVKLEEGITRKTHEEHEYASAKMTLIEVGEMSGTLDEGETEPKPGDVMDMGFQISSEAGAGFYKQLLVPLGKKLGMAKIRDIEENSKGLELLITVKRQYNKKKEKNFISLKLVAPL